MSVFCECCGHKSAVRVMAVVVAMAKAVVDATPFSLLLANAAAAGAAGQLLPGGWLWSYGQGTGALAALIV